MNNHPIFSLNLFKEHLKYYRIALIIIAINIPIVGVFINYFDNNIYDPVYLRLIICLLAFGVYFGTYFGKFSKKFHIYFNSLLLLIIIWAGFITFKNDFSFSTTFFYLTAIALVSFGLKNYKEIAIFTIISVITMIIFLKFSEITVINRFTIIVSIFFIQFVAFIVVRTKNISDMKLIESEKQLRELNATKDKLFSIIAHDLRSPFTSLIGFSSLLLKNIHEYDIVKIKFQIEQINKTANNTLNLLEDLLLWSKTQSKEITFKPQRIAFCEICNEIIDNIQENINAKGIKIICFEPEMTQLNADLNMFKTILRNLISNAIKFTNKNGRINVYSEINHEFVTIVVSDNGVGIEKENQNKLWDLSQNYTTAGTADEKGTGFGLTLCKEFVEKHGGKIWVESEVGKGSDFKFTMPLCND